MPKVFLRRDWSILIRTMASHVRIVFETWLMVKKENCSDQQNVKLYRLQCTHVCSKNDSIISHTGWPISFCDIVVKMEETVGFGV